MTSLRSCVLIGALTLCLSLLSLDAQVVTGAIIGRVTDTTQAVVPNATIQIQNVETGFTRTVEGDREGRYEARNLPVGSYSVTVQQAGFQTAVRKGITLSVGSEVMLNLELSVGELQQKIEVTAEASAIETTNATLSGLVNQEQMDELPLNGRSYVSLTLLSPGTLVSPGSSNAAQGFGPRISINGARADANLYLLDGTVTTDNGGNGSANASTLTLGSEAIREFRVLTHNFSAEYGRNSGAVLSAVTRSGTNEFHGSVYEYVRNSTFDARNFFNPAALPPFRRNQFGASLGGPVVRDRVFFFANYEGLRQRQSLTAIATVPDANARQGLVPNAAGQLTPVPFNPVIKPYLALYPLPNGRNFGDGTAQYISDFSIPTTEDYAMERMDFRLSDKDSFYWRYVFDPASQLQPLAIPTFTQEFSGTNHFVALSETHIFSGSALNEFRFAFNRTTPSALNSAYSTDPALDFIPGMGLGVITTVATFGGANSLSGQLSSLGGSFVSTQKYFQNLFQGSDSFNLIRGAHSLKFGVDIERVRQNMTSNPNAQGAFVFGGLLPLLAAQPSQFTFLLLGGNSGAAYGWRRDLFGWFIQDDFRLRSNLTLNLGLRHEFFTAPTEVNGRSANLRQITNPQSTLGPPFLPAKLNFSPRLGLAWDPTGSGKTSVRLGAGVYYNQVDGRDWNQTAGFESRFQTQYVIKNPPFPHGLANGYSPQLQATGVVDYHLDTPTVIQYNLELQRQLTPTVSLSLAYVGSYGYHMLRLTQQNIRIAQIMPDGSPYFPADAPFVNPNFTNIQDLSANAHYNYNGFQAQLEKTLSIGLRFQAVYTLSKALSDADSLTVSVVSNTATVPLDIHNMDRDYSLSAFDQRQTFVFNSQYKMPWDKALHGRIVKDVLGGWSINGIASAGSGLPLDVQVGFNNSRNGDANAPDRPNLSPGASNNPISGVTAGCQGIAPGQQLGTPTRWFDPCAFSLPPAGTFGNLGRNTLRTPGFFNVDFTLMKATPLTERKQLEFRAEFFNLLNHANFGMPSGFVFSSTRLHNGNEGVIKSALQGRQIQLGLKLTF